MSRAGRTRRVVFLLHPERPELARRLTALIPTLRRAGATIDAFAATPDEGLKDAVRGARPHLVVSIGGDGTILAAARAVAGTTIPLLPINLGGLGFLASAEGRNLAGAVRAALAGKTVPDRRRLLRVDLARRGRHRLGLAINDAVLRQGQSYRALRAELEIDGLSLGTLLADGLVVATATGSTAYSLSAGGPVLLPGVEALVATPVCPHTLASRSLVFGAAETLTARIVSKDDGISVSLDGRPGTALGRGDALRFAMARESVTFLRLSDDRGLGALRRKLGWQGGPEPRSP